MMMEKKESPDVLKEIRKKQGQKLHQRLIVKLKINVDNQKKGKKKTDELKEIKHKINMSCFMICF